LRAGLPHASSCDSPFTRVYENAETGVRIRPKRVYEIERNPQLHRAAETIATVS